MRWSIVWLTVLIAGAAFAQNPIPLDVADSIIDAANATSAAVASNGSGNFVVVWTDSGINAQRFAADGLALGGPTVVAASGEQPEVALAESGAFLVVWRDFETGQRRIKKRFYSSASVPTAAADVDADPDGVQAGDVVADGAGNFVVVWSENLGSYDYDVKARRYDNAGNALTAEQAVSSGTASDRAPRVAHSTGADGYVVVWDRETMTGTDIRGRLLDADAIPSSGDFAVNTYTTGTQVRAEVARSRSLSTSSLICRSFSIKVSVTER